MACSDVILRMGSMVNSFCNFKKGWTILGSKQCFEINQKNVKMSKFRFSYSRGILTHQMECFAVWFNLMLFHIFYKAAVCVSVREKEPYLPLQ